MLDAASLPGAPAPLWFVLFFKIVGFILHAVLMNLWLAGLPAAALCYFSWSENARRWAKRFFKQLPVIMAFGINFGIVPLLFIQVLFYKPFYTSTVLMAWQWLLVLLWLMISYYCVYIVAFAVKQEDGGVSSERRVRVFSMIAVACLFIAGITMTTGLTYMASPELWLTGWQKTQIGGAVYGTVTPTHNWAVLCRWCAMFGIAMITTVVWAMIDAFWFVKDNPASSDSTEEQNAAYRAWILKFAGYVGIIGAAIATVSYNYYLMKVIPANVYAALRISPYIYLTGLSAGVFLIPVILISFTKILPNKKIMAAVTFLAQIGAIAVYSIVRQWIQYLEISSWLDVAKIPTATQWSPMIAFLAVFVVGVSVCLWIVSRCIFAVNHPQKARK